MLVVVILVEIIDVVLLHDAYFVLVVMMDLVEIVNDDHYLYAVVQYWFVVPYFFICYRYIEYLIGSHNNREFWPDLIFAVRIHVKGASWSCLLRALTPRVYSFLEIL